MSMTDGASRTRTGDLLGAIQALFQLSYSPEVAGWDGCPRPRKRKDNRIGFRFPEGDQRMGILDEAIKEHLELKRQHGAGESELKQLEDEAFGEAERPDGGEMAQDPFAEAPTEFMSAPKTGEEQAPVAGEPAPAEEESPRRTPSDIAGLQEAPAPAEPAPADEPADEPAKPSAGHSTAERHAIAEQPTEMYDVEGEIEVSAEEPAVEEEEEEEEEEDFFDEKRLYEELDQALEAPVEDEPEPEDHEAAVEVEEVERTDEHELPVEEALPVEEEGDEHEDLLEDTPDFLEDAPEDDQLWFEQKPPKDFDFDD